MPGTARCSLPRPSMPSPNLPPSSNLCTDYPVPQHRLTLVDAADSATPLGSQPKQKKAKPFRPLSTVLPAPISMESDAEPLAEVLKRAVQVRQKSSTSLPVLKNLLLLLASAVIQIPQSSANLHSPTKIEGGGRDAIVSVKLGRAKRVLLTARPGIQAGLVAMGSQQNRRQPVSRNHGAWI